MEDKNERTYLSKVEYAGLIFGLLAIVLFGYRNQVVVFGVPLIISCYFIGKNLQELRNLTVLLPLALLLILGTRVGTGFHYIHILRDYAYFSSPLAAFAMGYFLWKRMPFNTFLFCLVLFGTLYSLFYFLQVTLEYDTLFMANTKQTRYGVGTGMPHPVLAVTIIICGSRFLKGFNVGALQWLACLCINLLAIYYFASRVYYFTLLLFLVPLLYDAFVSRYRRAGNYLFWVFVAVLVVGIVMMLRGDSFIAEKLKSSLAEMFIGELDNYESVIHNWRAYELYEAVSTFLNGNILQKVFGFGFGMTVYLKYGLLMPLMTLSHIPIFHNGFAYVLVKTGLLGIVLVLFFSALLLYKGYTYAKGEKEQRFKLFLLASSVLSFNFSMLVVNGFFAGESCILVILTGYVYSALRDDYKKRMAA